MEVMGSCWEKQDGDGGQVKIEGKGRSLLFGEADRRRRRGCVWRRPAIEYFSALVLCVEKSMEVKSQCTVRLQKVVMVNFHGGKGCVCCSLCNKTVLVNRKCFVRFFQWFSGFHSNKKKLFSSFRKGDFLPSFSLASHER